LPISAASGIVEAPRVLIAAILRARQSQDIQLRAFDRQVNANCQREARRV
jgi:hypothetical protein